MMRASDVWEGLEYSERMTGPTWSPLQSRSVGSSSYRTGRRRTCDEGASRLTTTIPSAPPQPRIVRQYSVEPCAVRPICPGQLNSRRRKVLRGRRELGVVTTTRADSDTDAHPLQPGPCPTKSVRWVLERGRGRLQCPLESPTRRFGS